jgi:glutamate synthase domain-containing protein 1
VFLPRTDLGAQERCRIIVETEILRFGHTILGWRQVPVDISVIGEKANATRPEIEQILIGRGEPAARQPRVREAALHPAPAHGEGGDRREYRRVLRLLAVAAAR